MQLFDIQNINTYEELALTFDEESKCIAFLEELRWGGDIVSPFDENSKIYKCSNLKYRCRNSGKYFNVRTNTIFHGSKVSLVKWFEAIWWMWNDRNLTITELAAKVKLSPKTAWLMQKRIVKLIDAKPVPTSNSKALTDWLSQLQ